NSQLMVALQAYHLPILLYPDLIRAQPLPDFRIRYPIKVCKQILYRSKFADQTGRCLMPNALYARNIVNTVACKRQNLGNGSRRNRPFFSYFPDSKKRMRIFWILQIRFICGVDFDGVTNQLKEVFIIGREYSLDFFAFCGYCITSHQIIRFGVAFCYRLDSHRRAKATNEIELRNHFVWHLRSLLLVGRLED